MERKRAHIRQADIIKDLMKEFECCRPVARRMIDDPTFPKPVKQLTQQLRYWLLSEYRRWKEHRYIEHENKRLDDHGQAQ